MSEQAEVQLPPVPTVDIARVLKTRDRLAEYLTAEGRLDRPTGDAFNVLVNGVAKILTTVSKRAVRDTLTPIVGTRIERAEAVALAWRLAANVPRLKVGRTILPDTWQSEPHWAALQVTSVRPLVIYPDDKDRRQSGAHVHFSALAGLSAPFEFRKFWSREMFQYAGRQVGFSAPWGKTPQSDEREFVNFRMFAYIDPALIRDGKPNFRHLFVSTAMWAWNRTLIKMRSREEFACPRRYPLEQLCYSCPAGQDECDAACHARSYVPGECPRCQKTAWFDPDPNGPHPDVCASCGRAIDLNKVRR